jgi:hypothetical protein
MKERQIELLFWKFRGSISKTEKEREKIGNKRFADTKPSIHTG